MSIAWHKIPHIEMSWTHWRAAQAAQKDINYLKIYNYLAKLDSNTHNEQFYIVGDQMSQMEGWMEGAVVSAMYATSIIKNPSKNNLPPANELPIVFF